MDVFLVRFLELGQVALTMPSSTVSVCYVKSGQLIINCKDGPKDLKRPEKVFYDHDFAFKK